MKISRRSLLGAAGLGVAARAMGQSTITLPDYEPRSSLHAKETKVERAKFPVIDIHTHLTVSAKSENGVSLASERHFLMPPNELLALMDRRNLRALTNLTGGFGKGLEETI